MPATPMCNFCNDRPAVISLDNPTDRPQPGEVVAQLRLCAKCAQGWQVPDHLFSERAIAAVPA